MGWLFLVALSKVNTLRKIEEGDLMMKMMTSTSRKMTSLIILQGKLSLLLPNEIKYLYDIIFKYIYS